MNEKRIDDQLKIDNVLSTQPELGPNVPDGGYGWIILFVSIIIQSIIPSLITSFGVYLMFSRIEHSTPSYQLLWDDQIMYVPLLFLTAWTLADPFMRIIVKNTSSPRLTAAGGTCLTCAGLLFLWMGINSTTKPTLFVFGGIFSGAGSTLLNSQTEILLSQYFNLKLPFINYIIQSVVIVSFVITPIILGNNILKWGLPKVIIWHQAIIIQCIILCLAFKKPIYLKSKSKTYQHIGGIADDEEDIFTRNSRELQERRQSQSTVETEVTIEVQTHNSSDNAASTSTSNIQYTPNKEWIKFDDRIEKPPISVVDKSFSKDFNEDLERIEKFEDDFIETPSPLFTEMEFNNNTTYSYEVPDLNGDIQLSVFAPVTENNHNRTKNINYLKQPTFYKSLLTIITTKFSLFIFYTLFPSFLYVRVEGLKVREATYAVGLLAIAGLFIVITSLCINLYSKNRPLFLWVFCWNGSIGYFILSDTNDERLLIYGAATIILCTSALQYIGEPLLGLTIRGETTEAHKILSLLSGVAFILFLIINFSFVDCFRLISVLQFITGCIWLLNFIYKKTKKHPAMG